MHLTKNVATNDCNIAQLPHFTVTTGTSQTVIVTDI